MAVTFTLGSQFQVDANGGIARVACLTATTAIALYSSAANGIEARFLTNTEGTITGGAVLTIDANQADSITICRLSDTSAVIGYAYGATHRTRVLTVSGTTLTDNAIRNMTDTGVDYLTCDLLDTNKVIYCYSDSINDGQARILSVSGTTITENAKFTFESASTVRHCAVGIIDSVTAIIASAAATVPQAEVLDISGTTITGNTATDVATTQLINTAGNSSLDVSVSVSDSNYVNIIFRNNVDAIRLQLMKNVSGTLTREIGGAGSGMGSNQNMCSVAVYKKSDGADPGFDLVVAVGNNNVADNLVITEEDHWFGNAGIDTSISTTAATTSSGQIRRFPGTTIGVAVWNASTEAITITIAAPTHIWLSTDGGATYIDIGDGVWAANIVGGVVVVPGTAYQTIFAAVGTSLYKTVDGGSNWTLETAVGYEVDFIDLEKDNTTVFLAKRDAAGTNRASLWDSVGASLTHINTGKSTTGGSTAGGDVV